MPAIYLSCAWILGIILGQRAVRLHPALVLFGLLPLLSIVFIRPGWRKTIVLSSLCVAVFIGAASYTGSIQQAANINRLRSYNDSGPIAIRGMLSRNPEIIRDSTKLYLAASDILIGDRWLSVSGIAILFVERYPEHHYGEVVQVEGKLETPPAQGDFDYAAFLAQQNIYSVMAYPEVEVIGENGELILKWVYSLRNTMLQKLAEVLPEPQAALAQGIALGIRDNIPATLKSDFARSGTAHLLAISGVNLTIVAGILVNITLWLFGRRYRVYIWVTATIVLLYAWLTGLQPPVLRAAIMVGFVLGADLFGRQRSSIVALFLAAVLMTAIEPKVLSETSFQMSFMAMFGLLFISPLIQQAVRNLVARVTSVGKMRSMVCVATDSFSVSIGAVIATWPLIAYYFGIFSWVGPLATFLTLPVLPAIIVTTVLSGGLGIVALPLGQAAAWIAWLPLSYLFITVTWFAKLPGASVTTDVMSIKVLAIYYIALALVILSYHKRRWLVKAGSNILGYLIKVPKKWVASPLALAAVLLGLFTLSMPDENVHVSFLNVGQGDAILIEKGNQQILVDGGHEPQTTILALSKKMPFWDRTIDMVVLTHPDTDHLGGLVEILRRYNVKCALSTNITYDSPLYQEWLNSIEENQIRLIEANAGLCIKIGDELALTVLNPSGLEASFKTTDINESSIVLLVSTGKVSFLLTGDLPLAGETTLIMQRANMRSTVLKVAHHGSITSTSREFLGVVNPSVAVISVGRENSYGHPSDQVMARLEQKLGEDHVYRTDRDGTIEFISDGKKLWVNLGD